MGKKEELIKELERFEEWSKNRQPELKVDVKEPDWENHREYWIEHGYCRAIEDVINLLKRYE